MYIRMGRMDATRFAEWNPTQWERTTRELIDRMRHILGFLAFDHDERTDDDDEADDWTDDGTDDGTDPGGGAVDV